MSKEQAGIHLLSAEGWDQYWPLAPSVPTEVAVGRQGENKLFGQHSVQDHDSVNCGQKKMNGAKTEVLKGWWVVDDTGVFFVKRNQILMNALRITYNPGNHVSHVSQDQS